MFFEESDRLVEQCSSLLNMGLGVMCGEICIRLAFFLESFCKTLLKTKKKKMIDDLWNCLADRHGQIWKVSNVLLEY